MAASSLRQAIARTRFVRYLRLWTKFRFTLRSRLARQLSHRVAPPNAQRGSGRPRVLVPVIETSHYQHLQVLVVAKALQLRGAEVKVVVCGQALDGCEIQTVRNEHVADPCLSCRFHERSILPMFGLDVVRLVDFADTSERAAIREQARQMVSLGSEHMRLDGVDLAQTVEDSVTRYFYGAVPKDREWVERLRVDHMGTALLNLKMAQRLAAQWEPDVIFTHMISYGEWEPYFKFFRERGTAFRSISLSQFDFSRVVVSGFELFQSTQRFHKFLGSRGSRPLAAAERQQLEQFTSQRTQGNAAIFQHDGYFRARADDEVKARIGFDATKRNIFLFSNLYWDVGLSSQGGLFDGVLDWVLQTAEILREHPECHLYIKPHPAEVASGSMKGVEQVVRERFPQLPANITIIEPQWKINTYQLFPLIDLGVIFTGTLGLEMMLTGIPVVSTGATSHKGLGFAAEPETLDEYHRILVGTAPTPVIERERLELFAYFYFIRTLMPWTLTPRAYANEFAGYTIDSLDDLEPGHDPQLDHLCKCILEPDDTVIEAWPDPSPSPAAEETTP